jgi:hypothetical protein
VSIKQRGGGDESDLVFRCVDWGFHGHGKMEWSLS